MRPNGVPQIHHLIEAIDVPRLNAQSPSKLGCRLALSLRTPVASRQRLRWAHHLASWTVAACTERVVSPATARQPPMCVNISGRGTPEAEGALPVQRSLWSYGHLSFRLAKLDPRAPRRPSPRQRCRFVLDQGRLWASASTDRGDAIPPSAST